MVFPAECNKVREAVPLKEEEMAQGCNEILSSANFHFYCTQIISYQEYLEKRGGLAKS